MLRLRSHRSVRAQALHYLARPHVGVPAAPVRSPAAWTSAEVADEGRWTHVLSAEQIGELDRSLARASAVPLARMTRADFPLPALAPALERWKMQVTEGLGFIRIRGLPVQRWSASDLERVYWGLGQHLGRPGAQNGAGELLGHVRDLRLGLDGQVRQYKTAEAIGFHCDAADAVGLLCVRPAKSGGLSRIVSSVSVFNAVLQRRPDLAPLLFERMDFDTRSDGDTEVFRARPATFDGRRIRTFYHSEYLRTAARHSGVVPLTPRQVELLDLYDALAASPAYCLQMELRPGDIQLISNHTVVHARTGYTDHDDPVARRHLLRLWLTLEGPRSTRERLLRLRTLAELLLDLARHGRR